MRDVIEIQKVRRTILNQNGGTTIMALVLLVMLACFQLALSIADEAILKGMRTTMEKKNFLRATQQAATRLAVKEFCGTVFAGKTLLHQDPEDEFRITGVDMPWNFQFSSILSADTSVMKELSINATQVASAAIGSDNKAALLILKLEKTPSPLQTMPLKPAELPMYVVYDDITNKITECMATQMVGSLTLEDQVCAASYGPLYKYYPQTEGGKCADQNGLVATTGP